MLDNNSDTRRLSLRDFNCDLNIAAHMDGCILSRLLIRRDVAGLIKLVYNNKLVPANQCVKFSLGRFVVHNKGQWVAASSVPKVTRELIETAYRVFRKHFDSNIEDVHDMFVEMELEPDMFAIEAWLEDLWDGNLYNLPNINADIIDSLKL